VRLLPSKDEERVVRMSGLRGVSTVLAISPLARECPVAMVVIHLNIGYHGVCACEVGVQVGEGLANGVKVCEFVILSPLE
jgi:hypothetical protein